MSQGQPPEQVHRFNDEIYTQVEETTAVDVAMQTVNAAVTTFHGDERRMRRFRVDVYVTEIPMEAEPDPNRVYKRRA